MIHLLPNDKAKCAGNLSVYTQPMLQQNSSLQNRRTQTPPPTMASLHSQCHLMETKKSGKTQLTPSCISQKKTSPLALDFHRHHAHTHTLTHTYRLPNTYPHTHTHTHTHARTPGQAPPPTHTHAHTHTHTRRT